MKKTKEFFGFSKEELEIFKKLNTPVKIQDFINSLDVNFEENGDTCMSPRKVLQTKKAHCIEGALLAATILRFHGYPPLILDFEATKGDYDHVVALFMKDNHWGAIAKTNHAVLRYREPVYKSVRELAMSFFHEYFLNSNGKKTLRAFSGPVDLRIFDDKKWMLSDKDVWLIPSYLTKIPHEKILTRSQIAGLRKADDIEIKAGKLLEVEPKNKSDKLQI